MDSAWWRLTPWPRWPERQSSLPGRRPRSLCPSCGRRRGVSVVHVCIYQKYMENTGHICFFAQKTGIHVPGYLIFSAENPGPSSQVLHACTAAHLPMNSCTSPSCCSGRAPNDALCVAEMPLMCRTRQGAHPGINQLRRCREAPAAPGPPLYALKSKPLKSLMRPLILYAIIHYYIIQELFDLTPHFACACTDINNTKCQPAAASQNSGSQNAIHVIILREPGACGVICHMWRPMPQTRHMSHGIRCAQRSSALNF